MENRAVFLDRDGTINVDKGYIHKIKDLEIIPGVVEGLKKIWAKYQLIVVTNQSGINRGLYTKEDYLAVKDVLHSQLLTKGVYISAEYFCPHISEDNCSCRKPKTGMLEQAAKDFNLKLNDCWMLGDNLSDIQAGKNAGCKTIQILTGMIKTPILLANFVAKDMIEAADIILLEDKNK